MIPKILTILLLLCFSIGTGNLLYWMKDGFSSRRIQSLNRLADETWDEEVSEALKQTFRYLGRGRQCFAFESADGKYVLKFPRTDIYKTPIWAQALPVSKYREKLERAHKSRQDFVLNSFHLSFHDLKEQTAMLAMHLGKSDSKQFLTVIDKIGCKHLLPISTTSFVLQYKKPILMLAFHKAWNNGQENEAKKILDALLEAIAERANKGILNRDPKFLENYGYDGTKAYQIDVGSFFKSSDLSFDAAREKSIRYSVDPIQEWAAKKAPEILPYLKARLDAIINK